MDAWRKRIHTIIVIVAPEVYLCPVADLIQIDVWVNKLMEKLEWHYLPNCTDRTGRNCVIVENVDRQHNRVVNSVRSFPNYIRDEVNEVADVVDYDNSVG